MSDSWREWDDPLASDGPCPWGGIGNYVLLDETCDWQCHFRESCLKIKKRRQQEEQGEIWRRLFHHVEMSDTEAYRELIEMLLPGGDCPKFPTCTHPDKDNYYCHDFCPWIPDLETWLEELSELRIRGVP